jgi:hypothetical protein
MFSKELNDVIKARDDLCQRAMAPGKTVAEKEFPDAIRFPPHVGDDRGIMRTRSMSQESRSLPCKPSR